MCELKKLHLVADISELVIIIVLWLQRWGRSPAHDFKPDRREFERILEMADNEGQNHKVKGVVDICFLIDATGSMQPCIDDIKGNIRNFITMLTTPDANGGVMITDWRACICGFRDFTYDPKFGRDAMVMNKFTRDSSELEAQLNALKAEGGGDEPESLLDALYTVVARGKTGKGAALEDDKWRYASDAARCVIVFTDASFHPEMEAIPGGTVDDVTQLLQQERIRLSLFAPDMKCHYGLSALDKSVYEAIEYDESVENDAVMKLREFTSDTANFTKTLEALAKSVSQSGSADIEIL